MNKRRLSLLIVTTSYNSKIGQQLQIGVLIIV